MADFGTSLKGAGPDRVLSLWLRDRGEAVAWDRVDGLLDEPEGALRDTALTHGGRAWVETTAGLGTVLGIDIPAHDQAYPVPHEHTDPHRRTR